MATRQMIKKAFRLHGRVQGVGFRWWTQRTAQGLGLRGWVRNRADGAVEVAIAGPEAPVKEMESRLHDGPRSANVERVEEIPAPDSFPLGFEIGF